MSEFTDHHLLEMLSSPDKAVRNKALTSIYQENFLAISTYIKKNRGKPEDAEDIFQDGLMAFYEQVIKGNFKGTSTIRTYLFAICKNTWIKRLRKASTQREIYGKEEDFPQAEDLILDQIITDEESKLLASFLDQIGKDCKKVLLFYYYERKRMKEIAKVLGFANEQVAKNKKNRCLKKLKELAQRIPHFKPFYRE